MLVSGVSGLIRCCDISNFLTVLFVAKNSHKYFHPNSSMETFLNDNFSNCLLYVNDPRKFFNISVVIVTLSKMTVLIGVMAIKSEKDNTSIKVGFGLSIFNTSNGAVLFFNCFNVAGIGKISRK